MAFCQLKNTTRSTVEQESLLHSKSAWSNVCLLQASDKTWNVLQDPLFNLEWPKCFHVQWFWLSTYIYWNPTSMLAEIGAAYKVCFNNKCFGDYAPKHCFNS